MNKVQSDFEKWATTDWLQHAIDSKNDNGTYYFDEIQFQWEGYQAAHNAQQAIIDEMQVRLDMYEAEYYNRQMSE